MKCFQIAVAICLFDCTYAAGITVLEFSKLKHPEQVEIIKRYAAVRSESAKRLSIEFETIHSVENFQQAGRPLIDQESKDSLVWRYVGSISCDGGAFLIDFSPINKSGVRPYKSQMHVNKETGVVTSLNQGELRESAAIIKTETEGYLPLVRYASWLGLQVGDEGNDFEVNWYDSLVEHLDDSEIDFTTDFSEVVVVIDKITYGAIGVERSYYFDAVHGFRLLKVVSRSAEREKVYDCTVMEVEDWVDVGGVWWPRQFIEYGTAVLPNVKGSVYRTNCEVTKKFKDIGPSVSIPNGTRVYDKIKGVQYTKGESTEVPLVEIGRIPVSDDPNVVIANIAKPTQGRTARTVLLLVGSLLLVLAVARFCWIRYIRVG